MKHDRETLIRQIQEALGADAQTGKESTDEAIKNRITQEVLRMAKDVPLSANDKVTLIQHAFYRLRGLDILQPLLDDPTITEIMVNGADHIFIEREGRVTRTDLCFYDETIVNDMIQKIVSSVNRVVNEANPICDAKLPCGSRVHVVLRPLSLDGPILTIRKFPKKPMDMQTWIKLDSITKDAANDLKNMVLAGYNIFVCGGTGCGKTSFLNALSGYIPHDERVITIEDSAELKLVAQKNLIRLETRQANTEQTRPISVRDLIRASLRMRPDRIIVGEVRGEEAVDMLQAMNTGHDGSLSTGHANSIRDMFSRLETMVLSGASLPVDAIRRQMVSALDIMVFLSRMRDKARKVIEIAEVIGCKDGQIQVNPLYRYQTPEGEKTGRLLKTEHTLMRTDKFLKSGIDYKG